MARGRTLTVAIMDIPPEVANPDTAFYIIDAALREGHNVKVFACEGAAEKERHATAKDRPTSLFELAKSQGVTLDWVTASLSLDKRESRHRINAPPRMSPKDLVDASLGSDATVVILVPK